MAAIDDGMVDSPFGRVSPEILDILNGGSGSPVAAPQMMPEAPQGAAPVAAPVAPQVSINSIPEQVKAGPSQLDALKGVQAHGGGLDAFREPEDPDSWSSAFGRGVDQLQANLGGTAEAIGEATGSQFLIDGGKQFREEQLRQAAEYGQASTPSFTGINSFDSALDYGKQMVGSIAPSLGATLGGMGAGALAGERIGCTIWYPR